MLLASPQETLPNKENAPSKVQVKVADFGIFGSNKGKFAEKHNAGSLKYMSPEILLGKTGSDPKIDVWSLGIMLYSMIFGKFPFTA